MHVFLPPSHVCTWALSVFSSDRVPQTPLTNLVSTISLTESLVKAHRR